MIVGLGGSLAKDSKSRAALEVALAGAADAGEVVRVAARFAADSSLHREVECFVAAERVVAAA
jgi:hypothetical protein